MKKLNQLNRQNRVRHKIKSRASGRARLSIFRSGKHISAQIINDQTGSTLISVSSLQLKDQKTNKTETASQIGHQLAQAALKAKISTVFFDRGNYKYHGRVKALAQAAREAGLKF